MHTVVLALCIVLIRCACSVPGAANLILEEVRANTLALESDFELATAAQAPPESGLAEWCAKSSDRLKLTRSVWLCVLLWARSWR